jgi:hypothetical protein
MKTTNRVLYLTTFIPKIQLASFLEIHRHTFDFYINSHKWRHYQIDKIDELFDYVKALTNDPDKDVKRIYFKNGCLICDCRLIRKLY